MALPTAPASKVLRMLLALAISSLGDVLAQRMVIRRADGIEAVDGDVEISDDAILQTIDQAVNRNLLATRPGFVHHRGLRKVQYLLDYVQFTQQVVTARFRRCV